VRRHDEHDERGVAALELAILLSVLMLLAFGAAPLYRQMRAYQRVSKTTAATLRYATAVDPNGRRDAGGTITRRPSYDQIAQFARDSAGDTSLNVVVTVCKSGTCNAASGSSPIPATAGDTVTVRVSKTVDMSVLGRVGNATARISGNEPFYPENDVTVTSTASAREE
jgi:Flp pilus assembly protein TadG